MILLENGPLTAPESLALYNFTLKHNFRLILAYHTQGRIIYWRFLDYFLMQVGYILEDTPYGSGFAGYKDWFIQNYNLPRLYY